MSTVYTVAFDRGRFLMVFNEKRGGWEMPGGSIESGETVIEAASREFREEAGYEIDILDVRWFEQFYVCAGIVLGRSNNIPEMKSEFFQEIPRNIHFDLAEYEVVIPWARSVADSSN